MSVSLKSVSLKAVLAAAMMFSAVSAQAQLLGPSWEANIILTPHDLDLIHAAVTNQVHGKPVGTTVFWNNPASGNSGSITLEKKLIIRNQQCEELAYTIRSSEPGMHTEHYHFTSCLQPDGKWKLA